MMKAQVGIILLFTLLLECQTTKSLGNLDATMIYTAYSRGFFKEVEVNQKQFAVSEKRDAEKRWNNLSTEDKGSLSDALKEVNLKKINTFEAPSNKRLYDGAAIAQLRVITKTDTFESAAFDHGNPPREIANLIEQLLKLESKP